jgi:hypothetical protein
MSRGPVLTRVRALPSTSRSGRDPLLVAHDISYRVKPDVKLCRPCIYGRKDASPATALTGDVPSQHLLRLVPSVGRRRQGHPAGDAPAGFAGKQCIHVRHPILVFLFRKKLPLHAKDPQTSSDRAQEDCLGNRR